MMKKQVTFLVSSLFVAVASTAQIKSNFPAATLKPNQFSIATKDVVTDMNPNVKAGGALIWESNFSDTTVWSEASIGAQGGWMYGAYPADFTSYLGPNTGNFLGAPMAFFNGIQYLLGGSVGVQNCYIESSAIDMSASEIVSVNFKQIYRRFNSDAVYVEVSKDNGVTWDSKAVNTDAVRNGATLRNTVTVDFLIGPNVTQGKIRFRWESLSGVAQTGSGYGWAIDDVKVLEGYENNLNLYRVFNEYGTQVLSATKMPAAQAALAGKISFGAQIENVGANTQPASVIVTAPSFSQTSNVANIASFQKDSLSISLTDGFPIPSAIGVYNFTIAAKSDSVLAFLSNDTLKIPFEVTNAIYAADRYTNAASITSTFNGWQDQSGEAGIGNLFEIFADAQVGAVQVGIGSVAASQQAQYLGRAVFAEIYVYNATLDDFEYVDRSDDHTIVAGNFGNLIKCYFPSLPTLSAGGLYLVIAGTALNDNVPIACSGFNIKGNTLGKDGESIVGLATTDNRVVCPVVRLDFTDYAGIKEASSVSNVSVSPNPFVGTTDITVSLKNNATVSAVVTDLSGRTVATIPAANMTSGENTIAINGTNFQAGVYTVTLTVDGEKITKRIIKN